MKKKEIVKNTWEFENIIKNGFCIKNRYYVIHYIDNDLKYSRYGISVSKKLGNAVVRNHYKRKIRSIIDSYKKECNHSKDYIIILRKDAIDKEFKLLKQEFFHLMKEKGNYRNEAKK